MIQGADNLISWYKLNEAPYWTVRPSKEKTRANCIVKSRDIENYSIKQGEEDLKNALNLLMPGTRYYIECKESTSSSSSIRETAFDLLESHQAQVAAIGAAPAFSMDMVQAEIAKGIAAYQEAQRIEALEARVKELIAENKTLQASPFEQKLSGIITLIEPHLQKYMPAPTIAPVASIGGTSNDEQERLELALEKWSKADVDFVSVIERISSLAVDNRGKYDIAKSML